MKSGEPAASVSLSRKVLSVAVRGDGIRLPAASKSCRGGSVKRATPLSVNVLPLRSTVAMNGSPESLSNVNQAPTSFPSKTLSRMVNIPDRRSESRDGAVDCAAVEREVDGAPRRVEADARAVDVQIVERERAATGASSTAMGAMLCRSRPTISNWTSPLGVDRTRGAGGGTYRQG